MTEVKFRGDLGANSDSLFKALSDGTRRALLEYLVREGEKNVVALTAVAGVSQPMVSRHMGKLKRAGLVTARRIARGEATPFPDPPERDEHGLRVAIWA